MPTLTETTAQAAAYWTRMREHLGPLYTSCFFRQDSFDWEVSEVGSMLGAIIVPGLRVLDFGCGDGRFREAIEGAGGIYVGVDLIDGLSTIAWDHETLPRGFDIVVAAFVIQHIADQEAYLHWVRELHRCLKYDGRLIVVEQEPFDRRSQDTEFLTPRGMLGILEPEPWLGAKNLPVQLGDHWFGIFVKKPLEMPQGDAPTFRMDDDGQIWAETIPMPEKIAISANLLEDGDRKHISRAGDMVTIEVENGRWSYRIVGWWDEVAIAELEEGSEFE